MLLGNVLSVTHNEQISFLSVAFCFRSAEKPVGSEVATRVIFQRFVKIILQGNPTNACMMHIAYVSNLSKKDHCFCV